MMNLGGFQENQDFFSFSGFGLLGGGRIYFLVRFPITKSTSHPAEHSARLKKNRGFFLFEKIQTEAGMIATRPQIHYP